MTLILGLYPDVLKMYVCTKIKFIGQCIQKLEAEQDRFAHRQTRLKISPQRVHGWYIDKSTCDGHQRCNMRCLTQQLITVMSADLSILTMP